MPTFDVNELRDFAARLLNAGGVDMAEAGPIGQSLVGADLRGHESHGIMRIPFYLDVMRQGGVVPGATFEVTKESPTLVTADGHWGFGQTQAKRLMTLVIDKARDSGMAIGCLVNSSHIGRLGEYCEQAAAAGLVSMVMVNTHGVARRVAPPGGREARLGTNPLAIGVPCDNAPLVLDFGTSATAEGKVRVKKIAGESCPEGWLLDADGRPTCDPSSLYATPPGTILPMGGTQAYKGFGLALMIEIFAGALTGGVTMRKTPINPNGNCVFLQAIDPAHLGGAEHFAAEVRQLTAFVRDCPRADGCDAILLPGDVERRLFLERTSHGIPIADNNWRPLVELAERLEVRVPESR